MVDPTSNLNEDVNEENAPRCAACDDPVLGADHRVITWIEDGEVRTAHFCDSACRSAWSEGEA